MVRMGQIRTTLPDDIHKALKARAALDGVTIGEMLIRLLREALGLERTDDA